MAKFELCLRGSENLHVEAESFREEGSFVEFIRYRKQADGVSRLEQVAAYPSPLVISITRVD